MSVQLTSGTLAEERHLLSLVVHGLRVRLDPLVRRPKQSLVLGNTNLHRLGFNAHVDHHFGVLRG